MSLNPQAEAIVPKIQYELGQFHYCYERMCHEWKEAEQGLRNMLIEDFMLHARVLRGFFVDKPKNKDEDVSARDFFDDPAPWKTKTAQLCPYLKKHQERLNKRIAHLTYSRLNEDEGWKEHIVYKEIMTA